MKKTMILPMMLLSLLLVGVFGCSGEFSSKEFCEMASAVGVGAGISPGQCEHTIKMLVREAGKTDPASEAGKFFVDEAVRVCEAVKRDDLKVDLETLETKCAERAKRWWMVSGRDRGAMLRLLKNLREATGG